MFIRKDIEKGGNWYIYPTSLCKTYIIGYELKETKVNSKYFFAKDLEYLYHVFKHPEEKEGLLFDENLCSKYLKYLTETVCITKYGSMPLLTYLFRSLNVNPGFKYWNYFEDILEVMNEKDNTISEIWNKYDYMMMFDTKNIEKGYNANYFINMQERDFKDVIFPEFIFAFPLPAVRPTIPEPSVENGIYRNTYKLFANDGVYIEPDITSDTDEIVWKVSNGQVYGRNFNHAAVQNLLLNLINGYEKIYDKDMEHCYVNKFRSILDNLHIKPSSDFFYNIEEYIYEFGNNELIQAYLKWNYFETSVLLGTEHISNNNFALKGILNNDNEYFSRLR